MRSAQYQQQFPNGLTVLLEQMPNVQSAAMMLLVPCGAAYDPPNASGTAAVLSDLVLRGAGSRNSRQLIDHLDSLGLQRSGGPGTHHLRFGCAALACRVTQALEAYADILRRAHLPSDGFEAARDLALQSLASLDDEPRQKVMVQLRERHLPWPWGRSIFGRQQDLKALSLATCRDHYDLNFRPQETILALAGNLDFPQVCDKVGQLLADWKGMPAAAGEEVSAAGGVFHEEHPSEQTHIGIAWPSIQETHPDYYVMRVAVEVLGGGMSSRLFTEIREKRALAYSVWAGYTSVKGHGSILGYAGTSNDRAQTTLDTFIAEVLRLSRGISPQELERAKIGLKASTIMQGESTSARAAAIAHDFFMRGRLRSLDEISHAIDAVSLDQVNDFLARHSPGHFTIVTLGPRPLKAPE